MYNQRLRRAGKTTRDEQVIAPKARLDYRYTRVLAILLPGIYAAILGAFCLMYRVVPGPEFIALCFFIYAAYNKTTRRFIGDWAPFFVTFLSYEAMDSVVGALPKFVHFQQPANLELQLFGSIPTLVLQHLYRSPVLDYLGAFFYSLHFIAPAVFAFVLWKYSPQNFKKFTLALALGTYGALVTFLVYPTAPPWAAVGAVRILFQVDNSIGVPFFRSIMDIFGSNPYAAFPSLHAMYPWIISLYALKIKKAKALPILVFPIGVWFSAVYLGEHYVIDVLGGIFYATCAFLIIEKLLPLAARKLSHIKTEVKKGSATDASGTRVYGA